MSGTPERIGRYEVLGELGRGAVGVVVKARDPQLDRLVAIKRLRRDLGLPPEQDAELKKRFYHEAVAAGRLSHPHLVAVHDVLEIDGVPYIVMEYVEGRTLAELVARDGPLPPDRAVALTLQVLAALGYAHARGVVHRDIKPGNILVDTAGTARLGDFGIARVAGSQLTQSGAALGTPAYMSPEQLGGQPVDGRSDLFSLAVVLYEALTGTNPFRGPADDLVTVLARIVNTEPTPARERNPAISAALDAVLARALAKSPEARYPTAEAFADALRRALDLSTAETVRVPAGVRGQRRRVGRRVGAGIGALLLGLGAAWAVHGWRVGGERAGMPPAASVGAGPEAAARSSGPRPAPPGPGLRPAAPGVPGSAASPGPGGPGSAPGGPAAAALGAGAEGSGCLAVNAVPFARVYVDGQPVGETPRACLRLPVGLRRVWFEAEGERSPERLVEITPRHTAAEPARLSYDFRARRFLEP